MKLRWLLWTALPVLGLGLVLASAFAQTDKGHEAMPELDCSKCHTCDVPTVSEPCLKACPRTEMVHQTAEHELTEAPDTMVLDQLADLYGPVRFNHKLHASMAEMGGHDCATCHHYSPPGEIPPCSDCHSPTMSSGDLRKPNLKGAYHRQCLACHREWSHDTKCVVCHLPSETSTLKAADPDPTDIMGTSHPRILEPVTKVYHTPYAEAPVVTFQHKEHIELFGLRCVDCHQKESCSYCHDLQKEVRVQKTQEEVHAICNDCHIDDSCTKCHDTKERPGFTHAATGWSLEPYHTRLDCRACHPTGRQISSLNNECNVCHAGWNQENFTHATVGLALDEMHSMLACDDCHTDRKFTATPTCNDCHDDDRSAKEFPPGEFTPSLAN